MLNPAKQSAVPAPDDQSPALSARNGMEQLDLESEAANDPRFEQTELYKSFALPDVFNEVAPPPGVEYTHAQLAAATQMNNFLGDATIGQAGGGALFTEGNDFYDNLPDADDDDDVGPNGKKRQKIGPSMKAIVDDIRREQEEEHARRWDAEMHMLGGKQFSGAELMEMREWMKDERHQQEFEDDLMKREGLSREQARERRQKMQDALDLLEKERRGRLTEEERLRLEKYKNDPVLGQDMKDAQKRKDYGVDFMTPKTEQLSDAAHGAMESSTNARLSLFDNDNPLNKPSILSQKSDQGGGISAASVMVKASQDLTSTYNPKAAEVTPVSEEKPQTLASAKPTIVTTVNVSLDAL